MRTAAYFEMADAYRRMFNAPAMMAELELFSSRVHSRTPIGQRHLDEAWHGTILNDILLKNDGELEHDTSDADEEIADEPGKSSSEDEAEDEDSDDEPHTQFLFECDSEDGDEEYDGPSSRQVRLCSAS